MFRRPLRAFAAALFALTVAGCGGGGGSTGPALGASGAAEIPASAALAVSVDTSFDSPATDRLLALLDRLPAKDELLARLRGDLAERHIDFEADVRPALGPELDIVLLDFHGWSSETPHQVVLTKPDDPAKLDALVAKIPRPIVHEQVDGWTIMAMDQAAIDRFKSAQAAGTRLAASDTYAEAVATLPSDPLVTVYVNGAPVTAALAKAGLTSIPALGRLVWASGALRAQHDGLSFDLQARGSDVTLRSYTPRLVHVAPRGPLAFVSFSGVGDLLDRLSSLPAAARSSAASLLMNIPALLRGEGAVYVSGGAPIPGVTAVLEERDAEQAVRAVDALAARFGLRPAQTEIGGVEARRLAFGPLGLVPLYYAAVGGRLVVTTAASAVRGRAPLAPSFASDPVFRSVQEAAGMPDATTGFLFVNLRDTIPLLGPLAASTIPREVAANLTPLQAFLAYGTVDGDVVSARLFLQIS